VTVPYLSLALLLFAGPALTAADDLESAFQNLKDAEAKKDAAQVKKLAAEVHALAKQELAAPAPTDADEKDAYTKHAAYVKEIDVHSEYSLYATAVQSPPETLVDLMAALEEQNPKSQYLDAGYGAYLVAVGQTGGTAKVPAMAEKALANFPNNEDLLIVLADNAMTKKQPDRAVTYATRLTTSLPKKAKPEGMSAADWERKRSAALGHGYWIAGVIHGEQGKFANADKELRAALPLIKGNDAMLGSGLFYLGLADYQLGKMTNNKQQVLDCAKFSLQAAGINSPYAQQAQHNALVCQSESAKMR